MFTWLTHNIGICGDSIAMTVELRFADEADALMVKLYFEGQP